MANINTIAYTGSRETLRDYRHAARIFTDDNFRLSPKYGFLFYVEFDFNPDITSVSNTAAQELGMIVKSATLPKFTIDTKVHNAYNRVNLVQNKIKYDPVVISFHDDQADNVRNFWYDYYSFFFRDPDYADSTYNSPHKYQSRASLDWGYSPRPTAGYPTSNRYQPYQYIQAIRIYSLYQKNFSEYQLINPIITAFRHGEHSNDGQAPTMSHEMTLSYETVKYLTGYTTYNTVGGFVDLHYDNTPSPISPIKGTNLVPDGQGGFTNAPDTITDLASQNPLYLNEPFGAISTGGIGGLSGTGYTGVSFGAQLGASTLLSATAGSNYGGFTIPGLGRGVQNISNQAILDQQLKASASNIVGGLTNNLSNALVGGLAKGLGPNGGAVIQLAVQAIANPKVLLGTAINMGATAAMNFVGQKINDFTSPIIKGIGDEISKSADTYLRQPAVSMYSDLQQSVSNFQQGAGFVTNAQLNEQFLTGTGIYSATESIGGIDIPVSFLNP